MLLINGVKYEKIASTTSPYTTKGLGDFRGMDASWLWATLETAKCIFVYKKNNEIDLYTDKANYTHENFQNEWNVKRAEARNNNVAFPRPFEAEDLKWKGEIVENNGVFSLVNTAPVATQAVSLLPVDEDKTAKKLQDEIFRSIFG